MIRFSAFESHGLALAAMTEAADGDFSRLGLEANPSEAGSIFGARVPAPITAIQIHGCDIAIADARGTLSRPEADGIATAYFAVPVAIRIADCAPLFLYEPDRRVCAIVHAGRKGTFLGIASQAIRCLVDSFHADSLKIVAHIGPSAGPCCYEVSEAIAKAFSEKGLPTSGRNLDLWGANALQLERAGLRPAAVTIEGRCTICDKSFHSYRRGGTASRNLAILAM